MHEQQHAASNLQGSAQASTVFIQGNPPHLAIRFAPWLSRAMVPLHGGSKMLINGANVRSVGHTFVRSDSNARYCRASTFADRQNAAVHDRSAAVYVQRVEHCFDILLDRLEQDDIELPNKRSFDVESTVWNPFHINDVLICSFWNWYVSLMFLPG